MGKRTYERLASTWSWCGRSLAMLSMCGAHAHNLLTTCNRLKRKVAASWMMTVRARSRLLTAFDWRGRFLPTCRSIGTEDKAPRHRICLIVFHPRDLRGEFFKHGDSISLAHIY